MFGILSYPMEALPEKLTAITGEPYNLEMIYEVGMRIYTIRHAFNLREGINPLTRNVPGRMIGDPPLKSGNVKDITVDYKTLVTEFLEKIGWDTKTTIPSEAALQKLRMEFLIDEMEQIDTFS